MPNAPSCRPRRPGAVMPPVGTPARGARVPADRPRERGPKKTPRLHRGVSFAFAKSTVGGLLAHRLLERAIDLLVRRVAAGLCSLGRLQRLAGRALGRAGSVRGAGGGGRAASAADLAAAASCAAALAAALAASMRASVSLLVQPVAVATISAATPTVSVLTIAVFICGCPRWLELLANLRSTAPVRNTSSLRGGQPNARMVTDPNWLIKLVFRRRRATGVAKLQRTGVR